MASAQLRGKLYKTGYRWAKALPKETQGNTAVQTPVMTTYQTISTATGSPGLPIPGTPQLRNPPRPTWVVMTVGRTPVPTQATGVTTVASSIPQTPLINISHIQDRTPQTTVTVKKEPTSTAPAAPAWKVAVAV